MNTMCSFCHAKSRFKFRAQDLNNHVSDMEFDYYRCPSCGLVYQSPIPLDLAKYYHSHYFPYDKPASLEQLEAKAQQIRFRIDMVQQYATKTGRLLEIGPSYGGFAFLAKQKGYSIDVIEMDSACCEFLKNVVGVNAICTNNVNSALAGLGQYDVIALWHVLEHLDEPWDFLDQLVHHLAPGGIIVLSTPNPDSFQFKLLGKYWMHLDAPRHLMLIPVKLLLNFLEARGAIKVFLTTTDPDSLEISRSGWIGSCFNYLLSFFGKKSNKSVQTNLYKITKLVINPIYVLILRPFERVFKQGGAYTLIVKK